MTIIFARLFKKSEIITNIVEILIQAETKTQMFDRRCNFHETLRKSKFKAAPAKHISSLLQLNFLAVLLLRKKSNRFQTKWKQIKK